MISATWRKRFSVLRNRLYLYPPPEPMPRTRLFWLATGLVSLAVIAFSVFFISYMIARQNAFGLNAEDFGIMDQAIWNTLHGNMLHQTICNIVTDTNCYTTDGVSRFAIHFEPILFPISLLYLLWPDPKVLLVVQTLVVASGAFPAFWLARLRLRNELAAVAIAVLYLLYPAQQQATVSDFHAVTFTAALLLFTLYFMYTRRTVWLFVFAILAMACKEEIPLVICMFGLWTIVFQQRWRSGLALVVLSLAWFALAFQMFHLFSPTGHPLLAARYGGLGNGPVQIVANIVRHPFGFVKLYVLSSGRRTYLDTLLSPTLYLPLLAPWVLIMAVPSLAINLLSSNFQMYSGLFQYNAEIVPILIFSTIEAIVLILWLVSLIAARWRARQQTPAVEMAAPAQSWRFARVVHGGVLVVLLGLILFSTLRWDDDFHGQLPFSKGFAWPTISTHLTLANDFISKIPADASVSAQTHLVTHLSHRAKIYLFPYGADSADYVLLDVTSDIYPYSVPRDYVNAVKKVLFSGNYGLVAAQNGYLLLKRGLPPPGVASSSIAPSGQDLENSLTSLGANLPDSFCSYIYASSAAVPNRLQATFGGQGDSINLIGFNVDANNTGKTFSRNDGRMTITTYWQVNKPITTPLQMIVLLRTNDGKEYFVNNDVPAFSLCQTTGWKPGMIVQTTTETFSLQNSSVPNGLAYMSIALLPLAQSSSTIMNVAARLPLHVVSASGPVIATQGTNALQLMPITIVK
ncbi:MAG TPA: DUF2079 domain-containing protein [Ktedonobacteraceae bacterium]|nr:DUF2079 domain-containing protein [Ktedonobacteraceae bacterium]